MGSLILYQGLSALYSARRKGDISHEKRKIYN